MKTLERIYWMRLGLGLLAGIVCTSYSFLTGATIYYLLLWPDFSAFFNGAAITFMIYIISYYAIKIKYQGAVQKPQKLVTTGVGIYFLSWMVLWIMLYTFLVGPQPSPA